MKNEVNDWPGSGNPWLPADVAFSQVKSTCLTSMQSTKKHSASSNFGFTAVWRDYKRKQNICRCWPGLPCNRNNLGENAIAKVIKCVSCCIGIRCHFCCSFCLHRLLSLSRRYFHFYTSFTEQGAKTNYMDDDRDRFPWEQRVPHEYFSPNFSILSVGFRKWSKILVLLFILQSDEHYTVQLLL